jgi:tRNA modification GTPase
VGFERAIVTEHPGTTRDAIEAVVGIDGYPFRLVDTAGLREAAEEVEVLGIEVAKSYLERADVVLFCVEDGRQLESDEVSFLARLQASGRPTILVRTKSDLHPSSAERATSEGDLEGVSSQRLSVGQGVGVAELGRKMLDAAWSAVRSAPEAPLVTRRRHVRALENARRSVEEFARARQASLPAEIAVTNLQDATLLLEELLGAVTTEDLLDRVFSSFCVGK